ncbi:hypothetical protein B296_00042608 [Ensete ventricosum]|uniref:Uncharacterized protein n=1 Tax=Ensete ventricosum TaxID=4639 RepID=A0A426ZHU7_ENSVE|nr:hypothetical protein B296_00042608 [Ensete ventricosum]
MEENGHASTYQREARSANWKAVLFVTPGELPHSSTGLCVIYKKKNIEQFSQNINRSYESETTCGPTSGPIVSPIARELFRRQCANGCVANFCCGFSAEGVSARMGRRGGGGKTGEWGSRRWAVGAGASRWLLLIPVHLTH